MNLEDALQSLPVLSHFTEDEIIALERAMSVVEYPDGHVFIREGQRGDAMYLILDGEVLVTQRKPGGRGQKIVNKMARGEIFGLLALIDGMPRSATCKAAGPVTAASLPIAAFGLLFGADSSIGCQFQYLVARQLSRDVRVLNNLLHQATLTGDDKQLLDFFRVV